MVVRVAQVGKEDLVVPVEMVVQAARDRAIFGRVQVKAVQAAVAVMVAKAVMASAVGVDGL